MTTFLLIPGLVCDGHVWQATQTALTQAGCKAAIADVTTQSSITEMATSLLERHSGPLVPVGHSMGGRVAMEMARIAPERIAALALLNTGMHPVQPGEDVKRQVMIDLAHDQGMLGLAEKWLPGMMAKGIVPDPAVMQGLTDMVIRMTPQIHERQMRALLGRPDAALTIGSFDGPMLLIVGRQDQWSPISQHEDIERLCPHADLRIIENAGHFAPVEQPQDTAQTISQWAQGLTRSAQTKVS